MINISILEMKFVLQKIKNIKQEMTYFIKNKQNNGKIKKFLQTNI